MRLAPALLAALVVAGWAGPASAKPRLVKVGTFDKPIYVTAAPGDTHRVFVVEKTGKVRVIKDGRLLDTPLLDISDEIRTDAEYGVWSIAFPPGGSGEVYVAYSAKNGKERVSRFTLRSADVADRDSEDRLLDLEDFYYNNNGGQLQFAPDGQLYFGIGDGGGSEDGPGDPYHTAQDPDSLFGKLLRIPTGAGGQPAVAASGLRNPWRFSFDRKTGALAIGDVGQSRQEEIDYLPDGPGGKPNLGWPTYEGRILRRPDEPVPDAIAPRVVLEHGHGVCAITGGYVSRDPRVTSTRGRYLFGDFCDGDIRAVRLSRPGSKAHRIGLHVEALVSFGEDARGRVYAVSLAGKVFRIAPRR